ncbi:hypothetical protein [Bdellovibrio sp. HCB337]|uniref:hypothetical protein n=1 Tax=Bdellovibrio sp. HCB337 TaxID=3394358 RepID=UPI0039A4ABE8
MKYLSMYMILGLIFLSSTQAIAAAGSETAASAAMSDAESAGRIQNSYDPKQAEIKLKVLEALLDERYPKINVKDEITALRQDVQLYVESQKACASREDKANYFCKESRNPDIKKYLMVAQVLSAGLSGMADACSKWGKVMDFGNKALTAYQAACSSMRGYCMSACGDAVKSIQNQIRHSNELSKKVVDQSQKAIVEYTQQKNDHEVKRYQRLQSNIPKRVESYQKEVLEPELQVKNDFKSVQEKKVTCDGYAAQLASAGVGILSMAKSFGEANECEDKTSTDAVAAATPVDCSIPANKQNNMTCICQDAPRTPGCEGGLDNTLSAMNADSLRNASTSDFVPTAGGDKVNLGGDAGGLDLSSKGTDGGGGSSLPGGPMGGGGGLGGSGGGFGGGPDKGQAARKSGMNTNILGGEGGGGGGGSWGGGYADPALRQYLPGGQKDPKAMAAQSAEASKQVTSQGGKSNWEKVRERYRDNKPSLLGY